MYIPNIKTRKAEVKTKVEVPRISATEGVSVMRGSKFGNPFVLPKVYDKNKSYYRKQGFIRANSRKDAIQSYEDWIKGIDHLEVLPERRAEILKVLESEELKGKTLKYFEPSAEDSHAVRLAKLVIEQSKLPWEEATVKTKNIDIVFEEDSSMGYAKRTERNASADATIAIAIDFDSAGERSTKKTTNLQKKEYIPIDANNMDVTPDRVEKIVDLLNKTNAKTLNIAGNGIYIMKVKYTQQEIDEFTYDLLKAVIEHPNLKNKIKSIRTGGQTGFDEAGAKAGQRLGISTKVLAPKGWKFRPENGKDISDEDAFMARFATE